MHQQPDLSVILPSFNNAREAELNSQKLDHFLSQYFQHYEIIIVEDGNSDQKTIDPLQLPAKVQLVSYQDNHGKGYAIKQGLSAAKGQVQAFTDSDLPYDLSFLLQAYRIITSSEYQMVAGDRSHPQSLLHQNLNLKRKIFSKISQRVINAIFLGGIRDSQCGIKAFSQELADKVFPLVKINKFAFDIEIYYLLDKNRVPFKLLPVKQNMVTGSSVRLIQDVSQGVIDIFIMIYRWYRLNRHQPEFNLMKERAYWDKIESN